jgi:phosphatidylglycerol---prolipoprotein diacylglyceryl transferase
MLPYLPPLSWHLWGGVSIHIFGLLVVAALVSGYYVCIWRCELLGLDRTQASRSSILLLAGSVSGSVVASVVLLGRLGMYSFGGIFSGVVMVVLLARWYRWGFVGAMKFYDSVGFAFAIGWIFGRLGCSFAHDHVGVVSNAWYAVRFPDGISRMDLGLIEFFFECCVALLFFWLAGKPRMPGFYPTVYFLIYGPFRWWIDGWRRAVPTGELSPDQKFGLLSIAAGLAGLGLMMALRKASASASASVPEPRMAAQSV